MRISDALAQARPGDTVRVSPGEYEGGFELRDRVNLVALTPGSVVIRPRAALRAAVAAFHVKEVTLSGFRVAGTAAAPLDVGLYVEDSSIRVSEVSVVGAKRAGIEIRGNSACQISGSDFFESGEAAILLHSPAKLELSHSQITKTAGAAVTFETGGDIELMANLFSGNRKDLSGQMSGHMLIDIRRSNSFAESTTGEALDHRRPK